LRDGRVLAACKHPNLVDVYGAFEANGTAYLVTRYEEGQDLERWLGGLGRVPTEAELRAILWPLLSGLERVHQAGFLHRDIRPANILLTEGGRPVLVDFGTARQPIGSHSRLSTAVITAGYAPFEQYHEGGQQGPWTDIYALAAVVHRAITGQKATEAADRMMGDDPYQSLAVSQAGRYGAAFLRGLDLALRVRASDRPQSIAQWRALLGEITPRSDTERREKERLDPQSQSQPPGPVATSNSLGKRELSAPKKLSLVALADIGFRCVVAVVTAIPGSQASVTASPLH
jgi:serine/threonine protein kinase